MFYSILYLIISGVLTGVYFCIIKTELDEDSFFDAQDFFLSILISWLLGFLWPVMIPIFGGYYIAKYFILKRKER